jgi:hypothetical protein
LIGTDGIGNIQNGAFQAAGGTANATVVSLPTGPNSITMQYSGDSNYSGSSSPAVIVDVQPDFAFAAVPPSITIARPGGSGTAMFTVTGQPGYTGTILFSGTSCEGLPRQSACSFSPASVTGNGSTTLTITTTAAHRLQPPSGWTATLGFTLAGIFLLASASRPRSRSTLLSLMTFAVLITIAACGGGRSSGGAGGGDPGTPMGLSTVIVTASNGTFTHTATLTLNVQ